MKRTPIKRTASLRATVSLKRLSAIKPLSDRAKAKGRKRKTLREAFLTTHPRCEACGVPATDVHEIIRRSQTKDAELRPELFISLCRPCHTFFTDNPAKGHEGGFVLWGWEDSPDNLDIAASRRQRYNGRDQG